MLIKQVLGNIKDRPSSDKNTDRLILSHEDIERGHQRVTSKAGRDLRISLDRGESLSCGDILYEDQDILIIVDMPQEKVFELRPKTNLEWARAAYNIGNMHQKAYLYSDCMRVPYDYVIEKMIESLQVDFSIKDEKLDGSIANVKAQSAGHSHEHKHSHESDRE